MSTTYEEIVCPDAADLLLTEFHELEAENPPCELHTFDPVTDEYDGPICGRPATWIMMARGCSHPRDIPACTECKEQTEEESQYTDWICRIGGCSPIAITFRPL